MGGKLAQQGRRRFGTGGEPLAELGQCIPIDVLDDSEQHVIEAAVMPSELEQLPDLSGFLKTASSRAWRRVRIARQPR